MIDDATAQLFLQHLDTAPEQDRNDMLNALTEYRDAAQTRAQQDAEAEKVRTFYKDPETLGGTWTKQMQDSLGPFQTNPQQDRAAWANVGFLALVNGKTRADVAPNYQQYRQQYGQAQFNDGSLDDLGFYNAVKGQYETVDNKRAIADSLASDATNNAFTQVVTGAAPDYSQALEAWYESNMGQPGFDASPDAYTAAYRAQHQSAFNLANENRDLFTVARDLLVNQTDRQGTDAMPQTDNQTGNALEEAAKRLSDATPDERHAVYAMLASWSKANYPQDPSGAMSRISEFIRQEGERLGRGMEAFTTLPKNVQESALFTFRDQLQSGEKLKTGNPLLSVFGVGKDITPEERASMLQQVNKSLQLITIAREVNDIAKNQVDPLRPVLAHGTAAQKIVDPVENAVGGITEFIPVMAAGSIPVVGTPAMMMAMGNQEYDRLRLSGVDPGKASIMAPIAGVGMGAIGSLRVAAFRGAAPMVSKVPGVAAWLESLSTPSSRFWRPFLVKSAIKFGEQDIELSLMNMTPAFVQSLTSKLYNDVPDVDWAKQFTDSIKSPETAITAMMFALVGQGISSMSESKAVYRAIQSPDALREAGIPEAKANEIAAIPDPAARETAFREAWQARNEADITQGQKIAEQRMAREKAIAESPTAPKLEAFGDRYRIVEPDGKVSATFDTPEAATQAFQDRLQWEQNGNAQAVRDLVQWYASKDTARKWEVNPNKQTLADEKQATPETVAEQMKLAGYQAGADPAKVQVFGSNVADVKGGIYTDVSRIHQGASPLDVVHERTHSQAKLELANGTIKLADAEKAVRAWMGDKAPEKMSEEALHEGIANMGVEYFAGNFRKIESLPASVRGFFGRMGAYFKAVFQRAAQLLRLKKEGKLDADWEAFLARAVGLDAGVAHNRATEEAAKNMGAEPAKTSFSIAPATYAEDLAKRMDAVMKSPSARLELWQRAKRELTALDRSQQFVLGVEKNKLGADKEQIAKTKMLQAFATLDAITSMLPKEARAVIGGSSYAKLAELQTSAARTRYIADRIGKLDAAFEKTLRKEYSAVAKHIFERFQPDRNAGDKPKGKLGADVQQIVDAAQAAMKLTGDQLQGEIDRLNAIATGTDATPEQQITAQRALDLIQLTGDWKNADAARMEAAVEALRGVTGKGWADWKVKQLDKLQKREDARAALQADTGKTGNRAERDAAEKAARSIVGNVKRQLLDLSSFTEAMHYVFGSKSDHANAFIDRERTASYQYEDNTQAVGDKVADLFKELAGGTLKGEQLRYDMAQKTIKTKAGEFSQFEAIQALLMWAQEDGRRHMMGKLDEQGNPVGKWHYDQAFVDDIAAKLTPEAEAVLSFLRKEYDAEYEPLNKLYRERHGISLPAHQNYAPITVDPLVKTGGEMADPLTGSQQGGSILTPGFLRSRSRSAVAEPEFRDALQTFIAHKKLMSHWASYYELATDMTAVLNHRETMNAVKSVGGEEAARVARKWLDYFAQGGVRDASAGLAMSDKLRRAVGRASQVALVGRVSVLMVQSTQLAAAAVKMPVGSYLLRFSKLMSGQLGWSDAIKSEFIQRRLNQMTPLVRQAMESLGSASRPNAIKAAAHYLGTLINGADGLFTAGTYAILLDYHRANAAKLGLTGHEAEAFAVKEATADTEAVAQPTRAAQRSLAELTATHPMGRALWSFASESRQKIAMQGWAIQNVGKDPVYAAKVAVLTFVVGGLMAQIQKNLWREAKGDDDEKKWSPQRLAVATVAGPLSGIPGVSALTDNGGGLFASGGKAFGAIEHLFSGNESDPARMMQDIDTVISGMGMFSDNAAALAGMAHVATDAAKLIKNVSGN